MFLRFFYVFLALAILTKGFVALILVGLVSFIFICFQKDFKFIKYFFDPIALFLFFLIALPWHILAIQENKNFAWFYFINEHFLRFLDQREPKDYYTGPLYYYLPRLGAYLVPWIFLFPFFIRRVPKVFSSPINKFLIIWFLAFFVFFSLSRAKANYYMMVGLPPLCLWAASFLERSQHYWRFAIGAALFSSTLTIGGVYYFKTKISEFSTEEGALKIKDQSNSICLYKRFEELSSFPFYLNRKVPILESQSRDLLFGQTYEPKSEIFKSIHAIEKADFVIVHTRDKLEFQKQFDPLFVSYYTCPNYIIFKNRRLP